MIKQSKRLDLALRMAHEALGGMTRTHWLCFGGLWAVVQNNGIIPDDDLDFCVYYEDQDWKKLVRNFEQRGYKCSKVLLNDTNPAEAVYAGFNHRDNVNLPDDEKYPHICLSFWYRSHGYRWYCHDQNKEVSGEGVPSSGYFFKGIPEKLVDHPDMFRMAEWPGIPGATKVMVPRFPGEILDCLYPDWAYRKQRYQVEYGVVDLERSVSVYQGGAMARHRVHCRSMANWNNEGYINDQLEQSGKDYMAMLRRTRK